MGTIIIATVLTAYRHHPQLFSITDTQEIGRAYSQSQYVLGDQAIQKIDDGTLYQYAAHAYSQREDPTTVNFEHPPLAKYFYAASLVATKRVHLFNIILFALCLILFSRLLSYFKLPTVFRLLAIIHLAIISSLDYHVGAVLLDMPTLFWSLLFFVILFSAQENNKKYTGLGLALGGFIATKYFFPIVFLYAAITMLWAYKKKNLAKLWLTLLIAGIIYMGSYIAYFLAGHSLIDFIKFEWFRFRWWTGDRTIPKFILLQTLFLGKFQMWWEPGSSYMHDNSWNISWPILFVAHLISIAKVRWKLETVIIWIFSLGLFAIFMLGSAVYGRYLLQLIPFWWITIGLGIYGQKKLP
jgi:hypothetical protein